MSRQSKIFLRDKHHPKILFRRTFSSSDTPFTKKTPVEMKWITFCLDVLLSESEGALR